MESEKLRIQCYLSLPIELREGYVSMCIAHDAVTRAMLNYIHHHENNKQELIILQYNHKMVVKNFLDRKMMYEHNH